ncbi:glutamic acid-rich protein-like [Ochlerotatus camptorhynchus]|uniref:glutamic acid-rich protein-like n=1 Tax=Ochlerotatus camptorhynchus TaxID=644619 RepID=UPI0031D64AD7
MSRDTRQAEVQNSIPRKLTQEQKLYRYEYPVRVKRSPAPVGEVLQTPSQASVAIEQVQEQEQQVEEAEVEECEVAEECEAAEEREVVEEDEEEGNETYFSDNDSVEEQEEEDNSNESDNLPGAEASWPPRVPQAPTTTTSSSFQRFELVKLVISGLRCYDDDDCRPPIGLIRPCG